jgi:hypothetical protein
MTDKIAPTIEELNCGNFCGVAGCIAPPKIVMLIPPTRATVWTPEEALVCAAWLVAMAAPFASVTWQEVLEKVENS